MNDLTPKLLTTLRGYTRAQLLADVTAGTIVGIVALPLAIAFGIASGVTPARGLVTAIVAGFLISALGGSRVQIGGPTGAFVVIVAGIVERHGVDGLTVATMMAGVLLVALGVGRLGGVIKFIPSSVVTGFTAGIAIVIFTTQVKDLLGLRLPEIPAEPLGKWSAYVAHLGTATPAALGISALTLAIVLGWQRLRSRLPGPFIALVVTTSLVAIAGLPVDTIGSRFGAVATSLPAPALPHVDWATLRQLAGPAFTIAMLAAIESLLSAVVADGMIGTRHRSNMELVAQGVANIVTPIFGGIPATGAIARTATNVRNGGRTPIAGIVHSAVLLLIVLFAAPLAARIPMATLAAILCVVAYHMFEWRVVRSELRGPREDALVLLLTLVLTVAVDLTVAVAVGLILAMFIFMKRMSEATEMAVWSGTIEDERDDVIEVFANLPEGAAVFEISGPLFFGAVARFRDTIGQVGRSPTVIVLRFRSVPMVDGTGLRELRDFILRSDRSGVPVHLVELTPGPRATLERAGLIAELPPGRVHPRLADALDAIRALAAGAAAA